MTFKERALQLINDARAAQGLGPLQVSAALEMVADSGDFHGCGGQVVHGRCRDMGERHYFNHAIKDCGNRSFTHMLVEAGIVHSGAGENVVFTNAIDDELVAASEIHSQFHG